MYKANVWMCLGIKATVIRDCFIYFTIIAFHSLSGDLLVLQPYQFSLTYQVFPLTLRSHSTPCTLTLLLTF